MHRPYARATLFRKGLDTRIGLRGDTLRKCLSRSRRAGPAANCGACPSPLAEGHIPFSPSALTSSTCRKLSLSQRPWRFPHQPLESGSGPFSAMLRQSSDARFPQIAARIALTPRYWLKRRNHLPSSRSGQRAPSNDPVFATAALATYYKRRPQRRGAHPSVQRPSMGRQVLT
jgi:hypothetical protein